MNIPLYDRFTHSSKGLKGTLKYIGIISLHVIIQSKLASCNLKSSDYTLQPCLELNLDHLLIEFKLPFLLIKSKLKHFITWANTGVAQYFSAKIGAPEHFGPTWRISWLWVQAGANNLELDMTFAGEFLHLFIPGYIQGIVHDISRYCPRYSKVLSIFYSFDIL